MMKVRAGRAGAAESGGTGEPPGADLALALLHRHADAQAAVVHRHVCFEGDAHRLEEADEPGLHELRVALWPRLRRPRRRRGRRGRGAQRQVAAAQAQHHLRVVRFAQHTLRHGAPAGVGGGDRRVQRRSRRCAQPLRLWGAGDLKHACGPGRVHERVERRWPARAARGLFGRADIRIAACIRFGAGCFVGWRRAHHIDECGDTSYRRCAVSCEREQQLAGARAGQLFVRQGLQAHHRRESSVNGHAFSSVRVATSCGRVGDSCIAGKRGFAIRPLVLVAAVSVEANSEGSSS